MTTPMNIVTTTTPKPMPTLTPSTVGDLPKLTPLKDDDFEKIFARPLVSDNDNSKNGTTTPNSRLDEPKLDHNIVTASPFDSSSLAMEANNLKLSPPPSSGPNIIKLLDLLSFPATSTLAPAKAQSKTDDDNQSNPFKKTEPSSSTTSTTQSPKPLRLLLKKADDFLDKNIDSIKDIFQSLQ